MRILIITSLIFFASCAANEVTPLVFVDKVEYRDFERCWTGQNGEFSAIASNDNEAQFSIISIPCALKNEHNDDLVGAILYPNAVFIGLEKQAAGGMVLGNNFVLPHRGPLLGSKLYHLKGKLEKDCHDGLCFYRADRVNVQDLKITFKQFIEMGREERDEIRGRLITALR